MNSPLLSVVVLNWNAKKYLLNCLDSLLASTYPNLEIILVDNASQDQSIEALSAHLGSRFAKIKVIINDRNYGAASALNTGFRHSHGKYVSFIASDTKVERDCFEEMVKVMDADPLIGAAEAKLLMMDNPGQFDHAGEYLNQFGLLMQRHAGQEIDHGQFDKISEIFSVKGTALTVRREVFEKVNGYDTDYFMFLEETDLCWRIWLYGYRIVFVPKAVIYHAVGASIESHTKKDYLVKYYGSRNYITTLIKNSGAANLARMLPAQLVMWLGLSLLMVFKLRFKEGAYIVKGVFFNLFNLKQILAKRRLVQSARVVSDKELMLRIMRKVSFNYLMDRIRTW